MRWSSLPLVSFAAALAACTAAPTPRATNGQVSPATAVAGGLIAPRLQGVTETDYRKVPGRPDCTAYTISGTLDGAPWTVSGTACRQYDGTTIVREHSPDGPDVVQTVIPPTNFETSAETNYDGGAFYVADGWDFDAPFGVLLFEPAFFGPVHRFGGRGFDHGHFHGGFHEAGFHGGGFHGSGGMHH